MSDNQIKSESINFLIEAFKKQKTFSIDERQQVINDLIDSWMLRMGEEVPAEALGVMDEVILLFEDKFPSDVPSLESQDLIKWLEEEKLKYPV